MSEDPPKRATRGKRIDVSKLAELEADQDEFWGKGGEGGDLFAEESDDESFDEEDEESVNKDDSEDSDIDNPDNEKAEAVEIAENDKDDAVKKKKNVYVDPARAKKTQKTKPASTAEGETEAKSEAKSESAPAAEAEGEAPKRGRKRKQTADETDALEGDEPAKKKQKKDDDARQLRKSTVQYSSERKMIRKIEKDEADQRKRKRRQNKKVERKYSQEELLAEARETEKINQESLAEMMKLEEERKKVAAPKAKIVGPRIITRSRPQGQTVTFTEVDELPDFLRAKAPPYPNQAMCVITGLPAKYLDPVTQLPYATTEAFKQLRAKYRKS